MSVERISVTQPNESKDERRTTLPRILNAPAKTLNQRNRKFTSLPKSKANSSFSTTLLNIIRHNKNQELVEKLNAEIDVDVIIKNDIELQKKKENIDNNNDIKMKRLGLLEKKTEKKSSVEKLDDKEKEKKIEKEFKQRLNNLEKLRIFCHELNDNIVEIDNTIEENKLELKILKEYAEKFDQNFKELEEKKMKEKIYLNDEESSNSIMKSGNKYSKKENSSSSSKNKSFKRSDTKKFEQINNFIIFKQEREDRKKYLKQNILDLGNKRDEEEKKLQSEINRCKLEKKKLYILRQNLINIHHLHLYEGLDFHGEGLITIIKEIWNLGVNVDTNFMPTYLDAELIDYLLNKAKQLIEITKIKKLIIDNQKDYMDTLKDWKIEEEKNNEKDIKRSSVLFKTRMEEDSYLDEFPKTKEFMRRYKKKYINEPEKMEIIDVNKLDFKSINIPHKILEKNNNIEKLKYLLQMRLDQIKENEKKQIERIFREFTLNNYEKHYKVIPEIVIGALCGEEKKNELLLYYNKLEKDYRDGIKVIQFHSNFTRPVKK